MIQIASEITIKNHNLIILKNHENFLFCYFPLKDEDFYSSIPRWLKISTTNLSSITYDRVNTPRCTIFIIFDRETRDDNTLYAREKMPQASILRNRKPQTRINVAPPKVYIVCTPPCSSHSINFSTATFFPQFQHTSYPYSWPTPLSLSKENTATTTTKNH